MLPAGLSLTTIQDELAEAHRWLQPATREQIAVGVGRMAKFAARFTVKFDAKGVSEAFGQMCADMPGDLLDWGIREALRTSTDSYRPPMPGLVWEIVADEMKVRRAAVDRLTTALRFGREDEPLPLDERVSAETLDEVIQRVKRGLAMTSVDVAHLTS